MTIGSMRRKLPGSLAGADEVCALILACGLFLASCAVREPLEFNVDNVSPSHHKIGVELRSISVKTSSDRPADNKVDWVRIESVAGVASTGTGIPVTRQWEAALNEAVVRSLIFTDNAPKTASLFVEVEKIEYSGFGTTHWDVLARYTILDRSNGAVLYSKEIPSNGSAGTDEAFAGEVRGRLALVRAIRANIQNFLTSLDGDALP